ncbi:hypothetical protein [Flindersiella endophytica]
MLDQIAAYTASSLLPPAGQKAAKGLWKRFVKDETTLAHAATASGRVVASTVVGTTVRAPRSAGSSPMVDLTIRQQTLDDEWHPFRQTDLIVLTEINTGATVVLQAPPGFSQQVALPAGRYRVAGVRLALGEDSGDLSAARVLALAAVTVAPFERLPRGWTAPAQFGRHVHSQPVTVTGPTGVDLAFVPTGEHGTLPATFAALLATLTARTAA